MAAEWMMGIPPPSGEALADADMEMIYVYVICRPNTVTQYIATRPIFDIAEAEASRSGAPYLLL